jgi:hypothetical protein
MCCLPNALVPATQKRWLPLERKMIFGDLCLRSKHK